MKSYRILEVVSAELIIAAAAAEQIQEDLSPALSLTLLDHPNALIGLQELDRLTQTLHSLARIVSSLSEAADPSHRMSPDVLASVNLDRLAARLLATGDTDTGHATEPARQDRGR